MNIRKLIRLILKIPATPFVVAYFILMHLTALVMQFFEWVYEARKWDKEITQSILDDNVKFVRKWFTTI